MNTYIKIVKNKKIKNNQLTKKSKTLYNDIDIEICQSTRTNQTASIQPKPPEEPERAHFLCPFYKGLKGICLVPSKLCIIHKIRI